MDGFGYSTKPSLVDKTVSGMNETRITYTHVDNRIIPTRVVGTPSMIPTQSPSVRRRASLCRRRPSHRRTVHPSIQITHRGTHEKTRKTTVRLFKHGKMKRLLCRGVLPEAEAEAEAPQCVTRTCLVPSTKQGRERRCLFVCLFVSFIQTNEPDRTGRCECEIFQLDCIASCVESNQSR